MSPTPATEQGEVSTPPRPGAGTPRPYRFPAFETRILPNGLSLKSASPLQGGGDVPASA